MNDVVFLTGVCHPASFNRAQGAYRLASVLRSKGYSCRVVDGAGSLTPMELRELISMAVSANTKIFGISTTFFSNLDTVVHDDSLVTKNYLPYSYDEWMYILDPVLKYPSIKIVVGGHKTDQFEKDKHIHHYVDHFIYGYADNIILDIINKTPSTESNITDIDVWNLETSYDRRDSFLPGECFTIEMQRGCIFKCKFCAYPMNGKPPKSFRRCPKKLINELKYCYDMFGSQNFILNSDTFNDDIDYLIAFNEEIQKANIKFNFGINARVDLFYKNNDMIHLIKDIGVRTILYGLESTNPFSLKHIGKGLSFEKVIDLLYACKEIWKNQIKITGSYIIGLPYDTDKNINKILNFFLSNNCPLDSIEFDPLYVPNPITNKNIWVSEYTLNPLKHGFIFKDNDEWINKNTPYKSFSNSVHKVKEIISVLPKNKKGTIKASAYLHLPNNINSPRSSYQKFEEVFLCNTYIEYASLLLKYGHNSIIDAKRNTSLEYFNLFKQNN